MLHKLHPKIRKLDYTELHYIHMKQFLDHKLNYKRNRIFKQVFLSSSQKQT